jgi:EmrB/QacA subfamily drug resistance transporter
VETVVKNRWLILLVVVMFPFMACLDGSIVNVALPTMANQLGTDMARISWVVSIYLITITALILLFGRLGDILGTVRIFRLGILLFLLGSVFCGLADSYALLLASRVVQAMGGAATAATNQGIITQTFPPGERGRALGINGTFVALGSMAGPPLGGLIISYFHWHNIFLINIPIGLIFFFLSLKYLPQQTPKKREKLDYIGAALLISSLGLFFYGLSSAQNAGFVQAGIIASIIIGLTLLSCFIFWERRSSHPLLDLTIFSNRLFSLSLICAILAFMAVFSLNIIQPFYLEEVLGLPPRTTGLLLMTFPLVASVIAPISGYLSDKIGSELLTAIGFIFTATGLFLLSFLTETPALASIIIFIGLTSLGSSMFQSPNTSLIMSSVPRDKVGIAGSVNALARNLGMVFGVLFATTILYNRMNYKIGTAALGYAQGQASAFVYGMSWAYKAAACLCILGAGLTIWRLLKKSELFRSRQAG